MSTAFQPSAFQNNAFQIDVSDSGHLGSLSFGGRHHRKRERAIKGYISVYEIVANRELAAKDHNILISALDPFIKAQTTQEQQRRDGAQYALESLPEVDRIDFPSLYRNQLAREKFESELKRISDIIEVFIARDELEEFILLLASV